MLNALILLNNIFIKDVFLLKNCIKYDIIINMFANKSDYIMAEMEIYMDKPEILEKLRSSLKKLKDITEIIIFWIIPRFQILNLIQ